MNRITEIIDAALQEQVSIKTVLVGSAVIIAGIAIISVLKRTKDEK